MTIPVANAAIRIARWAIANRDLIPADVRAAIATVAEVATRKLLAGPSTQELAELRGEEGER